MDVKPGYKQTQVGVIPEDWEAVRIGDLGTVVRGGSPRPAGDSRFFNGRFIPWLTVAALTNISENQLYVLDTVGFLTEEGSRRSRRLDSGTLIIANSGATLGVAKLLGLTCCANDGIAAIINQRDGIKAFVCHYINSVTKHLREVVATGNGQPNLNTTLIREMVIPFPPLPEQGAIAAALSDADALIESLEHLIAKKRNIKQGAMQELLTGKKRLPGFSGEWEAKRLGASATLKARIGWQGLTTEEYLESGQYCLVTGTDFVNGYIDWNNCHYVDESRYKQDKNIQLEEHDILVTKDGTVGKVALVSMLPSPATLNSGVFVIRPLEQAFFSDFFYYLLCSNAFIEFLEQLCAGSTITHLYQKDFVNFKFKIPPTISEQSAIATVFSDMDAELSTLESKLSKARQIKQGMMQELLTGRVRLV